ncbi:MAG TPA: PEP-CTERM sorting domain-containing protein [Tepidisphaeraceae bacterium]
MTHAMKRMVVGVLGVFVLAQGAVAAPIFWSNPSGSTSKITYSGGQSDKGLYGDPTLVGGTFQFLAPSNFNAESSNGVADTTSDRLSFKVTTTTGDLDKINVQEYGDWSILNTGIVKATGGLFITRLDSGHFGVLYQQTPVVKYTNMETGQVLTSPSRPSGDGSGLWRADYSIDLPDGTRTVQVVLNNILQASSGSNSTSFIEKKAISITAVTATGPTVPEPASLGLIALGGTVLLRRRRTA